VPEVNVVLLVCYLASTASLLSVHEHGLKTFRLYCIHITSLFALYDYGF